MALEHKNGENKTTETADMSGHTNNEMGADPFDELGFDTLTGGTDTEGFIAFSKEINRISELPAAKTGLAIKPVAVSGQSIPLPVIAMTATSGGLTAVYSLLIEGMLAEPLEPVIETRRDNGVAGGGYELIIDRPTSRCYGDVMRNAITAAVAQELKIDVSKIVHVSHCVVPDASNLESDSVALMYFDTAALALRTHLSNGKVNGITAAVLTGSGRMVRQRTKLTPNGSRLSRSGQPLACDFSSTLELSKEDNNNNRNAVMGEITVARKKYTLADVTGFIDFNVTPIPPVQPGAPIPVTQPGYIPTVVLTEIAGLAKNGKSIEDLRTQLLGLTTTTSLTANYGWVRIFDWVASKTGKLSIGHLGLEHDPYVGRTPPELGVVPVKSVMAGTVPKEGTMTPLMVAKAWCTPGVAVAMDIEQGGRLQWVQDVFLVATGATGDESQALSANAAIISECDALSNNKFSPMWTALNGNANAPVVDSRPITVHLGHYTAPSGEEKDLRSIDYLTMLSLLPKDLDKLAVATTAMIPGGCNALTLTERRKAITSMAPDAVFKGLASRVYMAPGFIQTLISAISAAQVSYTNDDSLGYDLEASRDGMNINLASQINVGNLYQSAYGSASVAPAQPMPTFVSPVFGR